MSDDDMIFAPVGCVLFAIGHIVRFIAFIKDYINDVKKGIIIFQ